MSFSYSRYKTYKDCPASYKYQYIDRIEQPPSPALERGNRVHKMLEDYIQGYDKLSDDSKSDVFAFEGDLKRFKRWYSKGQVHVERELVFDEYWNEIPDGWFSKDAWLRLKIDLTVIGRAIPTWIRSKPKDNSALIIDWKTGRIYDDHWEQLELYSLAVHMVDDIDDITAFNYYIDQQGSVVDHYYDPNDRKKIALKWAERGEELAVATKFPARECWKCRFCPYSKTKGGPCKKA